MMVIYLAAVVSAPQVLGAAVVRWDGALHGIAGRADGLASVLHEFTDHAVLNEG
jgi:hypothetical protein